MRLTTPEVMNSDSSTEEALRGIVSPENKPVPSLIPSFNWLVSRGGLTREQASVLLELP